MVLAVLKYRVTQKKKNATHENVNKMFKILKITTPYLEHSKLTVHDLSTKFQVQGSSSIGFTPFPKYAPDMPYGIGSTPEHDTQKYQ